MVFIWKITSGSRSRSLQASPALFPPVCPPICVLTHYVATYVYTHIWIMFIYAFCYLIKNTSFLTNVNKLCVCVSQLLYINCPLPILRRTSRLGRLHLQSRWNWSILEKMERHLSGTFIIPKSRGTASIFDEAGRLYAHPSWASRGLRLRCWQIYLLRQMYFTLPHTSSFSTFPWIYFPFLCILEASTRFTQDTDSCWNLSVRKWHMLF